MTDKMKHTPGPWETHQGDDYIVVLRPDDMTDKGIQVDNMEDAHLIAAAPELLEALISERQLRQLGQEPDVHWESLREARRAACSMTDAAIAKATGEQA